MSEIFLNNVQKFIQNKKQIIDQANGILSYNDRIEINKLDPTGIYSIVSKNHFLTKKELKILEFLSHPEVYEIFTKYEVYA